MSDNTHIEWTDATWNPITGCSVVSAGCKHCYAMKLAGTRLQHHPSRAGLTIETAAGPVWNGQVRFNPQWLDQPLRWKRPRRIFVCAHGDLFHESVPFEWIDRVWGVMSMAPRHTFQILTKRPERMLELLPQLATLHRPPDGSRWPLPNVWLGASVEHQEAADERIPLLMQCPAEVRWISAEPLLGPIDLGGWLDKHRDDDEFVQFGLGGLDWVVAGGESGTGARPMHPDWARSLRDQCAVAGVPFLFKQWGAWLPVNQMTDELTNRLYRSNRRAKLHEDQDHIDESWGRTCRFPETVHHRDGTLHPLHEPMAFAAGTGAMHTFEIGKKAAGRLLDGVLHDGYPA